jgi:hypothetical protein
VQRDREIPDLSGPLSRLAATLRAILTEASGARVPEPACACSQSSPAVPASQSRPEYSLPAPAGFASLIVADFPALFAEFGGKRFPLLWRGSRDGLGGRDFHGRCDGHANTLTFIEDADGNIFGSFTPVEWESPQWNGKSRSEDNRCKPDPSLETFLFTLKNPQNFPARKFALKPEIKDEAIRCVSTWVHTFVTLVFPKSATQTPAVTLIPMVPLARTTPAWTGILFSRARRGSL